MRESKLSYPLLAVIISIAIIAVFFITPVQFASAASLKKSFDAGSIFMSYRDIFNFDPTPEPMMSIVDGINIGAPGTITITDFNGNLDLDNPDSIIATANSGIITLDESDPGVFMGSFTAAQNNNIVYVPDPPESGRATASFSLLSPADVTISDVQILDGDIPNIAFRPVTHAVEVTLSDSAALDGTIAVTMSFANGIFLPDDAEFICTLSMFYKAPDESWEKVTTNVFDGGTNVDCDNLTVTSNSITEFGSDVTQGQFVLGFPTGLGGGGAGGLVRPGLVLNVLLGAFAGGGGGLDNTPPSLTSHISSGVQFDPFKPIAPGVTGTNASPQQAPLRINGNDYSLYGFSNTIVTNTIQTGQFTDLSLAFEEASKVEHVAVYFVDQGRDENTDRDPAIIIDNGNIVKVDPDGIFGDDIQLTTSKEGTKSVFNFGVSFDKPTSKNVIIVAWDDKKNSGTTKVLNAIQVVGNAIPAEVAHFMPIEALGEFDLVKDDNGQYVLSEPVETQTVIPDSPQTIVYPEFIGKMDRHDMKTLYDSKDHEKDKANSIMVQKFKLDTKLFADNNNDKPTKDLGQAPQLTWSNVGHKLRDLSGTSENKEFVKKMMWEEHLKAEKTLKAYLEQRNHRE